MSHSQYTFLSSICTDIAFSALTLLVGRQEWHSACRNWVVRYWRRYLSAARCKLFAYGPADVNATPSSVAPVKSRMVYLSGAGLPRLSRKKAVKWMLCYIWTDDLTISCNTRMWANAQRDGRPAKYSWRPLFNAAKFAWRPLLECRAVTLPRCETRWNSPTDLSR